MPQLSIRREVFGWLIAAWSRYGHFAAYQQRFSHKKEEDWQYPYEKYRVPLDLFGRSNARAHRALLWSEKTRQALSTEKILNTSERAAIFTN